MSSGSKRTGATPKRQASSLVVSDWGLSLRGDGDTYDASKPSVERTLVEMVLKEITDCLQRGETVKLSSFGSFVVRKKGQRIGRNPRTGKEVPISPRRVMVFNPSAILRQRLTGSTESKVVSRAESKQAAQIKSGGDQTAQSEEYDVAEIKDTKTRVVVVPNDALVERTISQVVERVPEIVRSRRKEITESNINALVDVYLKNDPVAEARIAIEVDNAKERVRFLTDIPCLTSRQIAEHAGHQAANTSMTASRWKQQGRVFSVPWKGNELYPAFQFRDGQPHPHVAKVLRELPEWLSPWQVAFWFTSSNGWLRGATPAERLDDESMVVAAAQRENEPIVG